MNDHKTDEKVYRKGDVIFREGELGSCMYKLLSGAAAVYADLGGPEEQQLTELHEGDYFGEMAVIEIRARSATVMATQDGTRVEVIDASDLRGFFNEHPDDLLGVTRHLSHRLRALTDDYTEVCDTLRELGRLDRKDDQVGKGLLARIRKFARVYLSGRQPQSEARQEPLEHCDRGMALHSEERQSGEVIFREGDASDCMYYIHGGSVGIFADYDKKEQRRLATLTGEQFFGEMGLFEQRQRSATAVALEDGTFLEMIYVKDMDTLYEKNPAMVLAMLQHLSNRLRRLTKDYLNACKTLADAEGQITKAYEKMTPEVMAQVEYMNQLLLMPEVLY